MQVPTLVIVLIILVPALLFFLALYFVVEAAVKKGIQKALRDKENSDS